MGGYTQNQSQFVVFSCTSVQPCHPEPLEQNHCKGQEIGFSTHSNTHRQTLMPGLLLQKITLYSRFQLRVALFVAAYLGHLDLAGWLLKRGLRAEEPVGVHPYRQWCYQTAHPEAVKCPVHTATEQGHLLILKLFISSCVLNLTCPDTEGRYPLKIAIQCGHMDCVRYLSTKLCSVVSLPYLALPMNIYLQIKRWVRLGEDRAASKRCQWHRPPLRARVGDTVLVDGFTQPKVLCRPRISETKAFGYVKHEIWQPFTVTNTPIIVHNLQSKQAPLESQLPKLYSDGNSASNDRKKRRHEVKCVQDGQSDKIRNVNSSLLWRSKVPLPPISCESNPRPLFISSSPTTSHILTASLESFSRYCGRTPRENAIYCLAMASSFTERPWLQQLNVARTLAKRSVQRLET